MPSTTIDTHLATLDDVKPFLPFAWKCRPSAGRLPIRFPARGPSTCRPMRCSWHSKAARPAGDGRPRIPSLDPQPAGVRAGIPADRGPRRLRQLVCRRGPGRLPGPPHGLATEKLDSPQFVEGGYWRGPIWAPSTMLVTCGLLEVGERDLARTIMQAFCKMCADQGFYENFSPTTGAGHYCPSYTWTSSVFLIFQELLRR